MYIANEQVVVVGTSDEVSDEIRKRVAAGWDVDSVYKRGEATHARFTKENAPPKEPETKK